ncbi:hypothetical protein HMPREF3034_01302, partial [Prevotella sp. DNF00663]
TGQDTAAKRNKDVQGFSCGFEGILLCFVTEHKKNTINSFINRFFKSQDLGIVGTYNLY